MSNGLASFSPVTRSCLKAVFTEAVTEFSAIHKAASCGTSLPTIKAEPTEATVANNPGTILEELNKVFFETLIRFEKCRREDYIKMDDGNFRKLNQDESCLRTFLEEISRSIEILKMLTFEIDEEGTFNTLQAQINIKQAAVDVLVDLAMTTLDKEETIRTIRAQIEHATIEFARQKELYIATLRRVRNEWQEGRQLSEMSSKYLKASYGQRANNYSSTCDVYTKTVMEDTARMQKGISQDKRQSSETVTWLCSELDSQANRLRYLQGKNDTEKLATELENLRKTLARTKKNHTDLEKQFAHCEMVVLDYRAAQEKKKLEEEFAQRYMVGMLQIQAWWRTMIEVKGIKLKKRKGKGNKKGKQKTK